MILTTLILIVTIILFLAVCIAVSAIRIVKPYQRGVVERLGRYTKTLEPGLTMLVPFIETARKVDMRETVLDVPPQDVITRDNVVVNVDAIIYYMIMDPVRVLYNVANFRDASSKLAQTNLRNVIGSMALDETLTSRELINTQLRDVMDRATDPWGIRVSKVEIKRIDPPADVTEAMHRQMKAERDRRAMILEAEGKRDATINVAEGDKKSAILKAEGEAQAMIKVAEAKRKEEILVAEGEAGAISEIFDSIHKGKPTNDLLTYKYLQTLEGMADGKATKIVVPYEIGSLMGLATSLGEILKKEEPKPKKG